MKFKFILPSLAEAVDSARKGIKYYRFPPLGLATLAAYLRSGRSRSTSRTSTSRP